MTYKALRNKVYSGTERMILVDYNGRDWLTDTYFAEVNTDLPARHNLTVTEQKANLALATQTKGVEQLLQVIQLSDDTATLSNIKLGISRTIQRKYYNYIVARYPDAKFATDDFYKITAVKVYQVDHDSDTPVVIVMPLKD